MGWKKRKEGSTAQIGQPYKEKGRVQHGSVRRKASGQQPEPQPRSVDSMKKPEPSVIYSYSPEALKAYRAGIFVHQGYYAEEETARKAAKKHKGVVLEGDFGIMFARYRVMAPDPSWKKEKKEHPWFTEAEAKRVAKDHSEG